MPTTRPPSKTLSLVPALHRGLRSVRERYRSLVENAVEGIFQTTPEGRYLLANPMLARLYGYDSPEEMAASLTDIASQLYVDHDRRDVFRQILHERDIVQGFESAVYRRDGAVIWISESARAVRAADGRLLGYEGTVVDITDRKRAEIEREEALSDVRRARDELEERVQERTAELEQAHRALADAATEKRRFYKEVIRCVTGDKLRLVSEVSDIPLPPRDPSREWSLEAMADYAPLRAEIRLIAESAGMTRGIAADLVLAVGEAVTNAMKHAVLGFCAVYLLEDRIVVSVRDRGAGIATDDLPRSLFQPGFSRAVSLGMGFTLMLELVDCVYMATDAAGTVLQLEKHLHPPEQAFGMPLVTAWDKL